MGVDPRSLTPHAAKTGTVQTTDWSSTGHDLLPTNRATKNARRTVRDTNGSIGRLVADAPMRCVALREKRTSHGERSFETENSTTLLNKESSNSPTIGPVNKDLRSDHSDQKHNDDNDHIGRHVDQDNLPRLSKDVHVTKNRDGNPVILAEREACRHDDSPVPSTWPFQKRTHSFAVQNPIMILARICSPNSLAWTTSR